MTKRDKSAVVIFAREPKGRVKTRLIPRLGTAGARELHRACLEATVRLTASLPSAVATFLYLTSPTPTEARPAARALSVPRGVRVRVQGRGNLGARLTRMFARLWSEGYGRVVVIGSDSPTLSHERLLEALAALRRAEAVLGPAADGGYYLIGLRRTAKKGLFDGVDWGTRGAFAQTRRNLQAEGLSVRVLAEGYDVDTPADLRRLEREVRRSRLRHLEPVRKWLAGKIDG
ncbi:MAG: TIGR04282 family arsenosugar biosynthesis glycosyltransferase [Acidobacteria bacterium]|nr:TIGR04282 family arsenosugar biosynthesis glycosyltransferase [Acidobacteriota bacterium]